MWKRIVSSILSSSTRNNLNNRNSASSETLRGELESLQSLVPESSNVGERVRFFEEAIASTVQLPGPTPVHLPSIAQRLANATPEEIVLAVDLSDIIPETDSLVDTTGVSGTPGSPVLDLTERIEMSRILTTDEVTIEDVPDESDAENEAETEQLRGEGDKSRFSKERFINSQERDRTAYSQVRGGDFESTSLRNVSGR